VKWCLSKELARNPLHDVHGGIIADEMGLGKTITMIGMMMANFVPKTLIVLPVALLDQWWTTIERTTGHKAVIYHGASTKKKFTKEELESKPVVLTTYGTIVLDAKKNDKLSKINWNRIIFDEAHHLRNKNTKLFISALRLNARHKWMVTGTPIQNSIGDLYALCSILGIPLEYYGKMENMKKIVEELVMKRSKSDVDIKLPELHEKKEVVTWSSREEQLLAEQLHENLSFSNLREFRMRNESRSSSTSIPDKYRLAVYNYAKQFCIYPYLIKNKLPFMRMMNIIDIDNVEVTASNGKKLNKLIGDIKSRINNGNRKLVFCDYQEESYKIQEMLEKSDVTDVQIIEGRTTTRQRKQILSHSPQVLIMQIQTGNEGLNLQQYNEIYFVSPGWNPCVEDQAVARSHRLGQNKPVYVYRYIMNGFDEDSFTQNIENYCETVQKEKRDLYKVFDRDESIETERQEVA
jgi:SNF2 family DNA or RNA helicase